MLLSTFLPSRVKFRSFGLGKKKSIPVQSINVFKEMLCKNDACLCSGSLQFALASLCFFLLYTSCHLLMHFSCSVSLQSGSLKPVPHSTSRVISNESSSLFFCMTVSWVHVNVGRRISESWPIFCLVSILRVYTWVEHENVLDKVVFLHFTS